jgi:hypothetical protein
MLAWLCANGVIWEAMQVAAWGKMFAGYSESMSFSQALRETLDPAKPCDMCVGIAKAKSEAEKKLPSPEQQTAAKFVLIAHAVAQPIFRNERGDWINAPGRRAPSREDSVRLRPPRV